MEMRETMDHYFGKKEDPANEAMERYLGGIGIGEMRTLGVEDMRALMFAIHSDLQFGEGENSGAFENIDDKTGEVTAKFSYIRKDSDFEITRMR